ncbi:MAG: Tetratricopeptide 2 repeat protein, partial [Candidatus Aminicenantes bacterium]|nr:Tetratricopeptide 2 repeat protein [Candidatus Aminicenantes bacterium]
MYPEAVAEANKALDLDPKWVFILNQLGYLYIETRDLEKAEEYLKKAVAAAPEDANPLDSLGYFYFLTGRLDEAIAQYKEAVRLKPDFGSEAIIAYIYAVKGDYAEALASLDIFILASSSKTWLSLGYTWKAVFHHILGQREQAGIEAGRAQKARESLGDKFGTALAQLTQANFHFERGDYETAIRMFSGYQKDILEAQPGWGSIAAAENELWLALVEWKRGRIESAKQKLDRIRPFFSEMPASGREVAVQLEKNFRILQSEIWLSEGRTAEVIDFLEKEFVLHIPVIGTGYARAFALYNFPPDQDVLARAYQRAGNLDRAIDEYKKLVIFNPASQDRRMHNPVYHYRLAKICEQKGLREEAKKAYSRFLELWKDADPGIPEFADARKRLAQF